MCKYTVNKYSPELQFDNKESTLLCTPIVCIQTPVSVLCCVSRRYYSFCKNK